MSSKSLSATKILNDITGEADQWEDDDFYQDDSYSFFGNDSEDESEEGSHDTSNDESPRKAPRLSFVPSCSEDECSICYCEFSGFASKLDCGHRFCETCVASYLKIQIDQAPQFHHRVSEVSRDDVAVVVTINHLVGVKCPHFDCQAIIGESKIKAFVDEHTWDKFDRFALDQTLTNLLIDGELIPCPLRCGYFVQEDCLCVNADCKRKQLAFRDLEKRRAGNTPQRPPAPYIDPTLGEKKLCPHCYCAIEKNGGCDHMYCIRCKRPFLWSMALLYNPNNTEHWMEKHGKTIWKDQRKKIAAWKGY